MNVMIRTSSGITQVPMETKQLENRVITVRGEITEDVALAFTDKLMELNLRSEKPVTVLLNSPGGGINSGLMMYDAIVGCRTKVRMVCLGKAYSMAAVLFAAADERLMLPSSELMIHQPLLGGNVSGNASSIKSISDSLLETKEKMNRLLASHTGKTIREIDKATSYDHYFSAQEAIDFNLCDRVISFADMIDLLEREEE